MTQHLDLNARTLRREAVVAALCGALVALIFLLCTPLEWLAEEPLIGAHVARGHGFLSAYNDRADANPTAANAPLYPVVVAGVYKVFGIESRASFGALYAINVLSIALTAAGVYVLASQLFGKIAARWAIVLFVIYPAFGRAAASFWDTLPSLAAFVWIAIWCWNMRKARSATVGSMMNLGLALGLLTLAHVTPVLTYPFLITMALGKTTCGNWFKMSTIAFLTFLMVLTPWTIRNYQVFGRIFAVRDNFPMEIWVGNQPGSYGNSDMRGHPATDLAERQKLFAEGENRYFDELWQRFLRQYHADPSVYWRHTLNRFGFLFVDSLEGHSFRVARICVEVVMGMFGVAGLFIAGSLKWRNTWLFWICLLSVLPYISTQVAVPYALPMRIGLVVYAGFTIAILTSYLSKRKVSEQKGSISRKDVISACNAL